MKRCEGIATRHVDRKAMHTDPTADPDPDGSDFSRADPYSRQTFAAHSPVTLKAASDSIKISSIVLR